MPRQPRLDLPDLIYHVFARGIERRSIFADDHDYHHFLQCLSEIVGSTETPVYAFALMPNHFHLLLRRTSTPLSKVMRKLLTRYAIYYNLRHARSGHLFQNRYKAIICQEERYFLELIRYINANPIRAKIVASVNELEAYPFSAHSLTMHQVNNGWFNADSILRLFSTTAVRAKSAYEQFVHEGLGRDVDLLGGGLRRSLQLAGADANSLPAFDDRILGDERFVDSLLSQAGKRDKIYQTQAGDMNLTKITKIICSDFEVCEVELLRASKRAAAAKARAVLAFKMSTELGLAGSEIAKHLGVSDSAVSRMIDRGAKIRNAKVSQ